MRVTVLVLAGLSGACRNTDTTGPASLLVVEPSLITVGDAPLSRELVVTTSRPTRLEVRMLAEGLDQTIRWPELSKRHDVALLGAMPDRVVEVDVVVTAEDGALEERRLAFVTEPTASPWVTVEVLHAEPERVSSGYVLLPLQTPSRVFWFGALDLATGELGWQYTGPVNFGDVRMTAEGTLIGLARGVQELSMLGEPLRRMAADPEPGEDVVPIPWSDLHHELFPLGNGAFASLTHRVVALEQMRLSYVDPTRTGPGRTVDDGIVVFDERGEVFGEWWMTDLLDPLHIGFDALDGEWSHGNAVIRSFSGDGLIAEARHQDTLFEVDGSGEVRWILSRPEGWRSPWSERVLQPVGEMAWPLHPHGPSVSSDGLLLAFDNGNDGASPYDTGVAAWPRSRVIAWEVDPDAMTVRTAWTWTPPGDLLFSAALGNATALPDGHVVACFGFLDGEGDVSNEEAGRGHRSVRVMEFVPGEEQPVADVRLSLPFDRMPDGVKAYRAVPTPSLYAADVEVERSR
ncbi:MAG: aryl-sulfate sulfotransferase [Alphaproteobacteria bacterium]|nr:aryl-sulfate sulfotransferase [Alphaproteobacteria bacterium]MCB9697508.1 aryl-sulfate sulfotransferase [Alphaproteobacteria bacterium]